MKATDVISIVKSEAGGIKDHVDKKASLSIGAHIATALVIACSMAFAWYQHNERLVAIEETHSERMTQIEDRQQAALAALGDHVASIDEQLSALKNRPAVPMSLQNEIRALGAQLGNLRGHMSASISRSDQAVRAMREVQTEVGNLEDGVTVMANGVEGVIEKATDLSAAMTTLVGATMPAVVDVNGFGEN